LFGGCIGGDNTSAIQNVSASEVRFGWDFLPLSQEITEHFSPIGVSWFQEESKDGEAITAHLLVNHVKVCSEVSPIEGMIGPSVHVKLDGVVWHRFSWDGHARQGASRFFVVVGSENGVVVDREYDVIECASSRL
jgi:hypothetical protein